MSANIEVLWTNPIPIDEVEQEGVGFKVLWNNPVTLGKECSNTGYEYYLPLGSVIVPDPQAGISKYEVQQMLDEQITVKFVNSYW